MNVRPGTLAAFASLKSTVPTVKAETEPCIFSCILFFERGLLLGVIDMESKAMFQGCSEWF